MSEQKTMNKFEAIAAMVRDGVKVENPRWRYHITKDVLFCFDKLTACEWSEPSLPHGFYTIYQEPPKMKTWYKGSFKRFSDDACQNEFISESSWLPSLEAVKSLAEEDEVFVAHEERQFPEVGV